MKRKATAFLVALFSLSLFSCGEESSAASSSINPRPEIDESALIRDEAGFVYSYHSSEKGLFIEDYRGNAESVVIPDELSDGGKTQKVVGIDDYAFALRKTLKTVKLGNNVHYIGKSAFAGSDVEDLYVTDGFILADEDAFAESLIKFYEKDGVKYLPSTEYLYFTAVSTVEGVGRVLDEGCHTVLPNVFDGMMPSYPPALTAVGDGNCSDGYYHGAPTIGDPFVVRNAGSYSFSHLSINNLVIAEGARSIGDYAFGYCSGLKKISLPDTLASIGDRAFVGADIESIEIPSSVTHIGDNAFAYCDNLRSIIVPKTVTSMGATPFANCDDIVVYFEAEDFPVGFDKDAVISYLGFKDTFEKDGVTYVLGIEGGERIALIKSAKQSIVSVDIPETVEGFSVKGIREKAFADCASLVSITLPSLLTTIGDEAFSGCKGLTSVYLPDSLETLGKNAFKGCSSLTSFVVPANVTSVGEGVLEACPIKDLTLPFFGSNPEDSEKDIGYVFGSDPRFFYSLNLERLILSEGCTEIPKEALTECKKLKEVRIPTTLSSIGDSAFRSCTSLASFVIPSTVAQIGLGIFEGCTSLSELSLPYLGATKKDNGYLGRFFGAVSASNQDEKIPEKLQIIRLQEGLSGVPSLAFSGCSHIKKVVCEGAISTVGSQAFKGCVSLLEVVVPSSITYVGDEAFSSCSSTRVYVSGQCESGFQDAETFLGYEKTEEIDGSRYVFMTDSSGKKVAEAFRLDLTKDEIVVPNQIDGYEVIGIARNAVRDGRVSRISLPNTIRRIGSFAFASCSNLRSISIPTSAINVERAIFFGSRISELTAGRLYGPEGKGPYLGYFFGTENSSLSSTLRKVTLVDPNVMIPENAFKQCNSLMELDFRGETVSSFSALFGGSVPSSVTKAGLVSGSTLVAKNCFRGCKGLESISLADSISSVGDFAFYECSSLASINIPTSLVSLGANAFYNCVSLASPLTLPDSLQTLSDGVFYNCSKLPSVALPCQLESISPSAFNKCSSLSSVTMPESLTSIGSYAFSGCSSLKSLALPEGLSSIGPSAFDGCSSLKTLLIPTSVSSIGRYCFRDCSSLTELTMPLQNGLRLHELYSVESGQSYLLTTVHLTLGSFTALSSSFFNYCNYLTEVTLPAGLTSIGSNAFSSCGKLEEILIPDTVTTIGYRAFELCNHITSFFIPLSVTKIEEFAFSANCLIRAAAKSQPSGWANYWHSGASLHKTTWGCVS